MNDEEIKEMIEKVKPGIEQKLNDTITEQIINSLKYSLSNQVEAAVSDYVAKEIIPEVRTILDNNKEEILEEVSKNALLVCKELTEGIAVRALSNLEVSYKRSAIIKALFE